MKHTCLDLIELTLEVDDGNRSLLESFDRWDIDHNNKAEKSDDRYVRFSLLIWNISRYGPNRSADTVAAESMMWLVE